MRDEGVRYGVMEVSSQALARHRVDGITFDTAVFTNLSPDHIGTEEHPDYATTGTARSGCSPSAATASSTPTTRRRST